MRRFVRRDRVGRFIRRVQDNAVVQRFRSEPDKVFGWNNYHSRHKRRRLKNGSPSYSTAALWRSSLR
jgi:hypothetical protein